MIDQIVLSVSLLLCLLVVYIIAHDAKRDEEKYDKQVDISNRTITKDFKKVELTLSTSGPEHKSAVKNMIIAFSVKHQANQDELIPKLESLVKLFKSKYNDKLF